MAVSTWSSVGRLRGNALQPQAGLGHHGEQRRAVLGGETDQLIRNSGDHRQQRDARGKASPEGHGRNQHVDEHGDQHDGHQEAGAAARMARGIFLRVVNRQRVVVLEGKDRLVLGAVVLVHAPDVGPQRDAPDEQQEQADANEAVNDVEQDLVAERRVVVLQLGGRQQRHKLVHENEEGQRRMATFTPAPSR